MKILVLGKSGQLASELKEVSSNFNYKWIFKGKNELNLYYLSKIDLNLNKINPQLIINCSAYTSVDDAENDKESANILNHKSVKLIAKWCSRNNCKLIHISTNFVYASDSNNLINENAKENPLNYYAKTKLLGDKACFHYNPSSIILRTSWLYSAHGDNFVKKMINLMKNETEINVVNDQISAPTYAGDLADVIVQIIQNKLWFYGVYNYSNIGNISKFDFANDIKEICGFTNIINSISSEYYSSIAKRPKYSIMDISKIKKVLNIDAIPYKFSLNKCIKILNNV